MPPSADVALPHADRIVPDRIIVARGPGETRSALMSGDILIAVDHRRDGALQPGAVYQGRVVARVPHMPAVFVDLGTLLPGMLKVKPPIPNNGAAVAVTVVVPERRGKGAELRRVSDGGETKASKPVGALLKAAPDPIAGWWNAYPAQIAEIVCTPTAEARRLTTLLGADAPVRAHSGPADLFAEVDEAIEAALLATVSLPCGGSIVIETTTAITTVDVNASAADPDVANREALAAFALEARRRNIAGHIVIDVIPRPRKPSLARLLGQMMEGDPARPRVAGLTPLGMIELTRDRIGLSLAESLLDADGRLSAVSVAYRALRGAVRFAVVEKTAHVVAELAPEVAAVLRGALVSAKGEAEAAIQGELRIAERAGITHEHLVLARA